MTRRRAVQASLVIALAAALVTAGWMGARAFTSPQQWAAQSEPPAPEPILATVEQGDLVDRRTTQAKIVPREQTVVALSPVHGAARSVVTDSPLAIGAEVTSGTVIARVNDAPVFVLASPFSFYRDLGVGDTGADVLVLQENLVRLGLLGATDGHYGAATARAVSVLYRQGGARAPERPDPVVASASGPPADPPAKPVAPPSSPFLLLSSVTSAAELPALLSAAPPLGADLSTAPTALLSSDGVVIRATVTDALAGVVVPGAQVEVTIAGKSAVAGRVERVFAETAVAAGTGTGADEVSWADVAVEAGGETLEAGALAAVSMEAERFAESALIVPTVAVARQEGAGGIVLLQHDDGSFLEVEVEVVASHAGRTAVIGDLRPGDRVRVD